MSVDDVTVPLTVDILKVLSADKKAKIREWFIAVWSGSKRSTGCS